MGVQPVSHREQRLTRARRRGLSVGFRRHVLRTSLSAVVVASGLVGAIAQATTVAHASASGSSWAIQKLPNGTDPFTVLNGVSCVSTTFCMAVGSSTSTANKNDLHSTLIERFNGARWTVAPSPGLSGSPDAELLGVSCTSTSFCVAVGYWTPGNNYTFYGPHKALIEIFTGKSWSMQAEADTGHHVASQLSGVSCTSQGFCMAAGYQYVGTVSQYDSGINSADLFNTLTETFNGTAWSTVPSPNFSTNWDSFLNAVSCSSPGFCAAVGFASPAIGNNDAALGSIFTQRTTYVSGIPIAETYQNGEWALELSASGAGFGYQAILAGVSCTSPTYCVAVGTPNSGTDLGPGVYEGSGLIETFDGTQWTSTYPPTPPQAAAEGSGLLTVQCSSSSSCTAAGGYSYYPSTGPIVTQTLVDSFDGSSWSYQDAPYDVADQYETLFGLSCPSSGCAAVGAHTSTSPGPRIPSSAAT
jgi:hypothetical protein